MQTADTLFMSLPEIWVKTEEHSRAIEIKRKGASIRKEDVKDDQIERLPDLGIYGNAEKATNIPIYENGLICND